MIALDFDSAILDRATRAAQLLELLCQRAQFFLTSHDPIYHCDGFPAAPFPVTPHPHNAIAFTRWLSRFSAPALVI
jgi:hypothetical protein